MEIMDQDHLNATENQRDENGRFKPGHSGFKPKGAVSRTHREFLERIEYITQILEESLEEKIVRLPAKAHVALWLELNKAIFAKKLPDNEPIDKDVHFTFTVVPSGVRLPENDKPAE